MKKLLLAIFAFCICVSSASAYTYIKEKDFPSFLLKNESHFVYETSRLTLIFLIFQQFHCFSFLSFVRLAAPARTHRRTFTVSRSFWDSQCARHKSSASLAHKGHAN